METTADAVDSGLLRFSTGSVIGTGGTIESANQRIAHPQRAAHRHPRRPGPRARQGRRGQERQVADARRRRRGQGGPPAADRRRGHRTPSPACCSWWRSCRGPTPCSSPPASSRRSRSSSPGCPDVKFDTHVFQQADFVKLAIRNLSQALVLGFLLVVVILVLFLFEWRVALISLLTIPLSLIATMLVLNWRGATINTMTLAGLVIALGAVVDDAIIDVENIVRRLRERALSGSGRVDGLGHPRRLAGGPEPDRLRDADHRRRGHPGLPADGPDRGVLPAAGACPTRWRSSPRWWWR